VVKTRGRGIRKYLLSTGEKGDEWGHTTWPVDEFTWRVRVFIFDISEDGVRVYKLGKRQGGGEVAVHGKGENPGNLNLARGTKSLQSM